MSLFCSLEMFYLYLFSFWLCVHVGKGREGIGLSPAQL